MKAKYTLLIGLALCVVLSSATAYATPLNLDATWFVAAARAIVHGARLYSTMGIDTNLPTIFFFSMPPVWLGDFFGVSPFALFRPWVILVTLFMGVLGWFVVQRSQSEQRLLRQLWIAGLVTIALVGFTDFGQREFLLLAFTLPYLLSSSFAHPENKLPHWLALTIGLSAAIGILFKPTFLFLPILVEIALWLRLGKVWLRREFVSCGFFGIAIGLLYLVLFPEYLTIMHRIFLFYSVFNDPIINFYSILLVFVLCVLAGWLLYDKERRRRMAPWAYAAASLAAAISALWQGKAWDYHFMPIYYFVIMGLGALWLAPFVRNKRLSRIVPQVITSTFILCATFVIPIITWQIWIALTYQITTHSALVRELGGAHQPLYVFSDTLGKTMGLVPAADVTWASRWPQLWTLPRIVAPGNIAPHEIAAAKQELFQSVYEDFLKYNPKIIIVQNHSSFLPDNFDYITYFSQDPRLAEIFSHYKKAADQDQLEYYQRIN